MQTFRDLEHHFGRAPAATTRQLSAIDYGRGREDAFRRQHPAVLKTLTEIAMIQSVEASNALEQITAPHKRIEQLVAAKTTPQNKPEAEILGYRNVLATIHASAVNIPVKPSVIEQLHRDLYLPSGKPGGKFKQADNLVEETLPDGTKAIRFEPVSAFAARDAMRELCESFTKARDTGEYHQLLLTAAFVLDFLVIHPFSDGNGRMSRLLGLLLLYQADYEVGRFISIEKLIDDSKESYYDALQASTHGWHTGSHDLEPWTSYFLGLLVIAYDRFEERVGTVTTARGAKAELIKDFIRSRVSDEFTIDDVRENVPSASDVYIRELLRKLKRDNVLVQENRGRDATWRRLHTDF
jgi:Fic family protein